MKSTEVISSAGTGKSKAFLPDVCKQVLFARLRCMNKGRLVIEDGEEIRVFGEEDGTSSLHAHLVIHSDQFYRRVLLGGATGAGEAYMMGLWSSQDVVAVIRVICLNQDSLNNLAFSWQFLGRGLGRCAELLNLNTKKGSKKNIGAHYDLSNDFFSLFLDSSMMYSAAIFPQQGASLEEASWLKLDHVCKRLNLSPSDHLLEIGTGWGGLAIHAAKHYGCKVTTTTISEAQYSYAVERVQKEQLGDQINLLKKDYRDLEGQYDKLVSIEMVEAVGHQYLQGFFTKCSQLLKSKGVMLMQAITTQDQHYEREKNTRDFIRKYIFPGGCLPSKAAISQCLCRGTDMQWIGLEDITEDYAETLAHWRNRFLHSLPAVKGMGFDDVFIRMWDFYLAYCEAGFRERVIHTSQFLFTKPQSRCTPVIV